MQLLRRYRRRGRFLLVLSLILGALYVVIAVAGLYVIPYDDSSFTMMFSLLFFPFLSVIFHRYGIARRRIHDVTVNSSQYSQIYELVAQMAHEAGFTEVPEVYLTKDPSIDPCTANPGLRPSIILGTDFIAGSRENNTPEAVRFMIAHQLGHMWYRHHTTGWLFSSAAIMGTPLLKYLCVRHLEFSADAWAATHCSSGASAALGLCAVGKDNYPYVNSKLMGEFDGRHRRSLMRRIAQWNSPVIPVAERVRKLGASGLLDQQAHVPHTELGISRDGVR